VRVAFDRQGIDSGAGREASAGDDPDALREALRRAHREIAELRADVAALSADRSDWLTVLAHELRTPLTVVGGYSRLLLSGEAGPLTDEQARYLAESEKSCRRLDAFISSLLDTVHDGFLEKGLEPAPNDLSEAIALGCALLGSATWRSWSKSIRRSASPSSIRPASSR
jgi:signal transduction histidine kinase